MEAGQNVQRQGAAEALASAVPAAPAGLALVIGAGGGLGAALLAQLSDQASVSGAAYAAVRALGRASQPAIDYDNEASLASAAKWVASQCAEAGLPLRLLLVASGFLHGPQGEPERSLSQLDVGYLHHAFAVNAIGPALVMKHFFPLLPTRGRCVAAFLSARVGSIGDNALGGWYGYRASKAALNQLVKTASIELARRNRQAICVALHPGTVATRLSQPFAKTGLAVRAADVAAVELLAVLTGLGAHDTGSFRDHRGQSVPW